MCRVERTQVEANRVGQAARRGVTGRVRGGVGVEEGKQRQEVRR